MGFVAHTDVHTNTQPPTVHEVQVILLDNGAFQQNHFLLEFNTLLLSFHRAKEGVSVSTINSSGPTSQDLVYGTWSIQSGS